jgi:type 1 glutamine amidotransferase
MKRLIVTAWFFACTAVCLAETPWVVFEGTDGLGKGKHVVLISGDEEYRSEETLPQLGKILAKHHGFKCTVLFAIDRKTGMINPNQNDNIPGLEALKSADLMVVFLRFRNLPPEQMKFFAEYVDSGKPIVGLRTSTHAFSNGGKGPYGKYHWQATGDWSKGFGKQILGETWVNHHGKHGTEGTRGVIAPGAQKHAILRGIKDGDIYGPSDVYTVNLPLTGCESLVLGQVVSGLTPDTPPVQGKKNDPMMPIAWTKTYQGESGATGRVFTTTMGASQDFESEGLRRLLVNACYWTLKKDEQIAEKSKVDIVGPYEARPFRNNGFKPGVKPSDHAIK